MTCLRLPFTDTFDIPEDREAIDLAMRVQARLGQAAAERRVTARLAQGHDPIHVAADLAVQEG